MLNPLRETELQAAKTRLNAGFPGVLQPRRLALALALPCALEWGILSCFQVANTQPKNDEAVGPLLLELARRHDVEDRGAYERGMRLVSPVADYTCAHQNAMRDAFLKANDSVPTPRGEGLPFHDMSPERFLTTVAHAEHTKAGPRMGLHQQRESPSPLAAAAASLYNRYLEHVCGSRIQDFMFQRLAIVAPVIEELFFRGLLARRMLMHRRTPPLPASRRGLRSRGTPLGCFGAGGVCFRAFLVLLSFLRGCTMRMWCSSSKISTRLPKASIGGESLVSLRPTMSAGSRSLWQA